MNIQNNLQEMHSDLLDGIVVVDFSQFLAGPLASLKLADFGARVIKVERPVAGDLCRNLYLADVDVNGINTLFHAINRNKESYSADLKNAEDLNKIKQLISHADIVIQNFRPGVIERIGLGYQQVKELNPSVIYASVTGYGRRGQWSKMPGQDLLAQARTGLLWLSGNADHDPTPMGLAVADQLAGNTIVQGILAALVKRSRTGQGAHIETSLVEALLDFQFEVLTTYMNDEKKRLPQRSKKNNAHAFLAAPYGVYQTRDNYIAIAMAPVHVLATVIGCSELEQETEPARWFSAKDEIKAVLAKHLKTNTTNHWMDLCNAADIWAAEVIDWSQMFASEGFQQLDFIQKLRLDSGQTLKTTRSPIRTNGKIATSSRPAPSVGQHNQAIEQDFGITGH